MIGRIAMETRLERTLRVIAIAILMNSHSNLHAETQSEDASVVAALDKEYQPAVKNNDADNDGSHTGR